MNKAVLLSANAIKLVNILNGKATVLVVKKVPKDYKGWVYIYCTKGNWTRERVIDFDKFSYVEKENRFHFVDLNISSISFALRPFLNGKIVARFWLDAYDEAKDKDLYALHIKNLEIFDEPKELKDFTIKCDNYDFRLDSEKDMKKCKGCPHWYENILDSEYECWESGLKVLSTAPKTFMYVYARKEN